MGRAFKVSFTKRFVDGSIAGLEYRDSLHFATSGAAQDFAKHCQEHANIPVKAMGGANYTCHDIAQEKIEIAYADLE